MASLRFSHLGICVSDLEAALGFYRDALGFTQTHELEVEGEPSETLLGLRDVDLRAVYLRLDDVTIELLHYASPGHVGERAPRAMNALGPTHLSLGVDDLDRIVADLTERGFPILRDTRIDHPGLGARAIFVTDPDGTRVELVEMRGDVAAPPEA